VIAVRGLTKRYGGTTAVEGLSFDVRPGVVTGFLGPNGSGKSTTIRIVLGLDRPTAGTATVDGRAHRDLPAPSHRSERCRTPGPSTARGPPGTISTGWHAPPACRAAGWTRSSTWSA
jgi:ABC-type lipoprotein export system ATPase subunit